MTGTVPSELATITGLVRLLETKQAEPGIGFIPSGGLRRLYLDGNSLSGAIPTELGSLSFLAVTFQATNVSRPEEALSACNVTSPIEGCHGCGCNSRHTAYTPGYVPRPKPEATNPIPGQPTIVPDNTRRPTFAQPAAPTTLTSNSTMRPTLVTPGAIQNLPTNAPRETAAPNTAPGITTNAPRPAVPAPAPTPLSTNAPRQPEPTAAPVLPPTNVSSCGCNALLDLIRSQ